MAANDLLDAALAGDFDSVRRLDDIDSRCPLGKTALMVAASKGRLDIVKLLVDCGADVNAGDADGWTASMWAAKIGDSDILKYLVDQGADANTADNDGWTALMRAAGEGHLAVVEYLVECGANVTSTDCDGWTAMMWAAAFGHTDVVIYLIDSSAGVNATDNNGSTALIRAAANNHSGVIKCVVERGAEVNASNINGWSALLFATLSGDFHIVECLVDRGADLNAADSDGSTAMIWAARYGHSEILRYLADHGADINAVNNYERSALLEAALNKRFKCVKCLTDCGADVNAADGDGWTALMWIAKHGRVKFIKYLVLHGADVNTADNDGWTVLMRAAVEDHLGVVKFLVECGADVNSSDDSGITALMWVADNGNIDTIKCLVEQGADVNAADNDNRTVLMWATTLGHLEVIMYLVDCGADVNTVADSGKTVLIWAAENGHLDVVKYFIDYGVDVNAVDKNGWTALMWAASNDYPEIVSYLIDCSADVDGADIFGWTAMMWAARNIHFETMRYLIDRGANVNTADVNGKTTFIWIAENGLLDIVKYLIDFGADVNAAENDGWTALMWAARNGHDMVVSCLIAFGADVNASNNIGWTPLMWAANNAHLDIVKCLIDFGANVNAANSNGTSILMTAAEKGYFDVMSYLIDRGANVNATDNDGWTAMTLAARNDRLDVVKYLVKRNADVNATDNSGRTALMKAIENGHVNVMKILSECNADLNAIDNEGRTALMQASSGGLLDIVKYLTNSGANVNVTDKVGRSAVMRAAENDHSDIIKWLVDCGADVNTGDSDGRTALMNAIEYGRLNALMTLLDCGVDTNAADNEGRTALMRAARIGRISDVESLVDSGACVSTADANSRTALMMAAQYGHFNVVVCLVEHGADVSGSDKDGWTSTHWAANGNHLMIVRYLLNRKADMNATDSNGWTSLMRAAENGHVAVLNYLVDSNADVNVSDNEGWTALMRAADRGHLTAVKYLIEHKADVNAVNNQGWTTLMIASRRGLFDMVKYLIDRDADINVAGQNGLKAADIAAQHGHNDIQRLLARYASASTMTPITNPTSVISSSQPDLAISPFDINVTHVTSTTGGDFVGTWLDADVALKLFVPDAANVTFQEEVALWHQLRHPNVIKLYGACDVGHNIFVCELASNGSVVDYLNSCSPEKRRPWKYLHQAALGLTYLHERGIIHGDLRGSNILIGDDGQAKLADFGMSGTLSHVHELESSGDLVWSLRWQAPELLRGEKPSRSSDVYALGLFIVELLTRKIPWCERTDQNVRMVKKVWEPGSNDRWYRPGKVPKECEQLIKQLCRRDPAQRASASVCVHLFERCAQQEDNDCEIRNLQSQPIHQVSDDVENHRKLADAWLKIEDIRRNGSEISLFGHQHVFDDLQVIYDLVKQSSQPIHLIDKICALLQNTTAVLQNGSQTALVLQLSSTKAIGNSMHSLLQCISELKRQLGLQKDPVVGDPLKLFEPDTQLFVSEVSKSRLILEELVTSEERAVFLSYLQSEINQNGSKYTVKQRDILQKTYDEIKSRLDADEEFTNSLPVWFIPWYELSQKDGQQIGSGGFGSVYCAKWLDSDVVVKRLETSLSDNPNQSSTWTLTLSSTTSANADDYPSSSQNTSQTDERSMFEREVNIWFNLSHPHVVRLFGACHVGRHPFFVCEYASNGSLDKYLLKHPEEIWKKLHEAALGLLYLHERGIVHCDLKCNNIVVGSDKKAKVTDFGLSLAATVDDENQDDGKSRSKQGGNISGAWNWLAPELMLGQTDTPSRESDVFSFGMCIVEALRVVASVRIDPEERENLPPRVPWINVGDKETAKFLMKRGRLPDRPPGSTDSAWELVKMMCKFNPSERIQMCTVVDKLSVMAGILPNKQHSEPTVTTISTHSDLLALVSSVRDRLFNERSIPSDVKSLTIIHQMHELLLHRIEDTQMRLNGNTDALNRLGLLTADAQSTINAIPSHSDSLLDFTEMSLEAYGLHRRLDKLLAAAFVANDDSTGMSVHNWKRKCYEFLGVDSSVAAELLHFSDHSIQSVGAV